jgi:hypothetical protein
MKRIFALGLLGYVLATSAQHDKVGARSQACPYCIPETTKVLVRALAQETLTERWIPSATMSPDFYQVEEGLDLTGARLVEPFLNITLRGPALDHYLDSNQDDPRPFASAFQYCFPIYLPDFKEPLGAVIIGRNRDESGNKFVAESGEFTWVGYWPGGTGSRLADAVRLRDRFKGEVSFVQFLDTFIPDRIMLADSLGPRSAYLPDSLKSIADDAREIKRQLAHQRKY